MNAINLKHLLLKTVPAKLPVLITGAPGIGKSEIVDQVAKELNNELIIEHPVVSDPTDFKGFPFPDKEKNSAEFLPFGSLNQLIHADKPTIYFLDDLGQAPTLVQAACMQLILARKVNGHHVSPHVCFIAATNRQQDRAGVHGLLEPLKSRFASIVELQFDIESWSQWALANQIPIEFVMFARFTPNIFKFKPDPKFINSCSPRTFVYCSKLYGLKLEEEIEFESYSGSIGEGAATELIAFLKIYRELPNPDAILMSPDTADIPKDLSVLYALCGALGKKASVNTADRLFHFSNRLPIEFSIILTREMIRINPQISNTKSCVEWCVKHSDVQL